MDNIKTENFTDSQDENCIKCGNELVEVKHCPLCKVVVRMTKKQLKKDASCNKCGQKMQNMMYCSNCKVVSKKHDTEEDNTNNKQVNARNRLIIIVIASLLCLGVFSGFKIYNAITEDARNSYNKILKYYNKDEPWSALNEIENFNKRYSNASKSITEKVLELYDKIEVELYEETKNEDEVFDATVDYMEYFPNGKYIDEVKDTYIAARKKQASEWLERAQEHIEKGEYSDATYYLDNIISSDDTPSEIISQAKKLSEIVEKETAIVENFNGYNRFKITRSEFIQKYNSIGDDLNNNVLGFKTISSSKCFIRTREQLLNSADSNIVTAMPNVDCMYYYDTTVYLTNVEPPKKDVEICVDENDYVIGAWVVRSGKALSTDDAMDYFMNVECVAAYMSITGEDDREIARDKVYDSYQSPNGTVLDGYEYGFIQANEGTLLFVVRVNN